ncbi:peptidylprolyl isomerase [Shewanella aestuarii]|uniref:Peptidyl-prolyl cis-trans isomerase n=1 Tax=Shewanella aestuarii TaxID=1028752 RepID=A0A6G9QIX4_9GAMM|nr:peptidylprolyl isomerase [Shewanella aestuarii]QIR14015.1 peptidylprolyl isomerase [Shewanella aestuarii]
MKPYLSAMALLGLTACGGSDSSDTAPVEPTTPDMVISQCYNFETTMGDFVVGIDNVNMPITSENFSRYVDEGFYNNTIFHRIVNNFVNQGGGFSADLDKKATHGPIKNESSVGLKNEYGTIAMARTQVLDSATSQFFINISDNDDLDYPNQGGYAVFGKVVAGMEVVDMMNAVNTTNKTFKDGFIYSNVPVENIVVTQVSDISCPD